MTTLSVSPELHRALEELAEANGIEVDTLAENLLLQALNDQLVESEPNLSIEELKEAIEESEAEEAQGIGFTDEEVFQELFQNLDKLPKRAKV